MARRVNVITTCFNEEARKGISPEQNLQRAVEMLDAFGSLKPDLVCLPEVFLETGVSQCPATDSMTEVVFNSLSEKARHLNSYIVAGAYEHIGPDKFNVAWLIDRSGRLVGRYAKYHPTIGEIRDFGIKPGREMPIFETDFGIIGLAICYDIGWPSLWRTLGEKGAELVVWISAYDGGFPLQAYAWENLYYVVSSVRTNHSRIIDKTGKILASSSRWAGWASRVLDLDKEVFHIDGQYDKLIKILQRFGGSVTVESFSEENIFTLESNAPDWPLNRIIQEFDLETFRAYHKRAEMIQDETR